MIRVIMYLFFLNITGATVATSLGDSWRYSAASYEAQKDDWQKAYAQMSNLLVNNYDRADLLYDTGVAAYRNGNFEQARSYFERALSVTKDSALQERIHFNLGNTHVALKELQKALTDYENALKINKDNAQAKHNWQKVKEMLDKQKQQQQQQDQQNKDKDKDQQQDQNKQQDGGSQNQDQQNKQDQSKQDQNDSSSNKKNGEKNKDQQQDQQQKGDQQQQDGGQQQNGNDKQQEKDQQSGKSQQKQKGKGDQQQPKTESPGSNQQQEKEDKKSQEQQGEGGEQNQDQQDKLDQKDSEEQRQNGDKDQDGHQDADDKKPQDDADKKEGSAGKDTNQQAKSMQGASLGEPLQPVEHMDATAKFGEREQWMVKILEAQENADKKANKQFMKSTVNKRLGGNHGQNNW